MWAGGQQGGVEQASVGGGGGCAAVVGGGLPLPRRHCHSGSWGRGLLSHSTISPSMISCSVVMVRRILRHATWQWASSARSQQYRPGMGRGGVEGEQGRELVGEGIGWGRGVVGGGRLVGVRWGERGVNVYPFVSYNPD